MITSSIILAAQETATTTGRFTWIDWAVVIGYLAVTTWIGHALTGKQATIRDFFLGGRKLPWPAVAGAIIATEISAVTFVGVPAIMFAREGNMTYLQLGLIGSILARLIVGYVFVPVYYAREIYSPYDYMANQLGGYVRTMTTCLFTLGGMLAQGARVYLTALILDLVIGQPAFGRLAALTHTETMTWSIVAIGVVAIVWTWMGGITTVIWTDVLLFLVFLIGGFAALGFVIAELPGGWGESIRYMCHLAWDTKEAGPWGKFTFFDFDISPAKEFTIWTAAIAATWGGLGSYGTDQLMSQRMFCCKNARDARRAIIASSISQITTATMLFVGIGLFAYYHAHPLTGAEASLIAEKTDRIFPLFIINVVPTGIAGLLIAAIFAAAISSLDGILTALSQTSISAFYLPYRAWRTGKSAEADHPDSQTDPKIVLVSRISVLIWGIILCGMAYVAEAASDKFPAILNLALSMAGYAGGALLAGFMLAFLKLRIDGRGFMWSAPMSVLLIFALVWHQPWTHVVCWAGTIIILVIWVATRPASTHKAPAVVGGIAAQTLVLLAGLALILFVNYFGYLDRTIDLATGKVSFVTVAWPWFTPIGSLVAFVFGFLLARRNEPTQASTVPA